MSTTSTIKKIKDGTEKIDSSLRGWLIDLATTSSQADNKKIPAKTKEVMYFLEAEYNGDFTISLAFCRFKKNGERSQTIDRLPLARLLESSEGTETIEDDLFFYAHAKKITYGEYSSEISFHSLQNNQISAHILKNIALSGRLYYGCVEDSELITWGEDRPGKIFWDLDSKDRRILIIKPESQREDDEEDTHILLTNPLLYYDERHNIIGYLSTPLPDEMALKIFKNDQPIPKKDIPTVQEFLKNWLSELPELKQPNIINIDGGVPKVIIQLDILRKSMDYYQKKLHFAKNQADFMIVANIKFRYGDIIFDAMEAKNITIFQGERYCVKRNIPTETSVMQAFLQKGEWIISGDEICHCRGVDGEIDSEELDFSYSVYQDVSRIAAEKGWDLTTSANYPYHPVAGEIEEWYTEAESTGIDWFDVDIGVSIGGKKVNLLPLIIRTIKNKGEDDLLAFLSEREESSVLLKLERVGHIPVPTDLLKRVVGVIVALFSGGRLDEEDTLRLSKWELLMLQESTAAEKATKMRWIGDQDVQTWMQRLVNQEIADVTQPDALKCTLRPYQQRGLSWLQHLRDNQIAGVLADDMGLGKTIQALAHILVEKEAGRLTKPVLIVAPTSLMVNWKREAERFAPSLKVLVLQGAMRKQFFDQMAEYDIILTTYPLLGRDKTSLLSSSYHLLLLDEAHIAKNPNTLAYKILQQIQANHRLCLTGTPMENHLGDLWSLYHFLSPGFLGDSKSFRQVFRTPIEKEGNEYRRQILSKRVAPFLLRRTKDEVVLDLPPKTTIIKEIELHDEQKQLYEAIRLAMNSKVQEEISKKGLGRSHIIILDALLKMRQVCCHPQLMNVDIAKKIDKSAKLDVLLEMVQEMVIEKRHILIFSQFTSMLQIIEEQLIHLKIPYVKLTGQTVDRETPIEKFQSGQVPIFLISLKAGGVGLNLTTADTVIHYDPWWNPAVENQATDRAHRIGQTKPVFVYKLVSNGTIEEKIIALQNKKSALLNGLFDETKADKIKLTEDDIRDLFAPIASFDKAEG